MTESTERSDVLRELARDIANEVLDSAEFLTVVEFCEGHALTDEEHEAVFHMVTLAKAVIA